MADENESQVIRFKPSEMARAIRSITTPTNIPVTLTITENGIYTLTMNENGFSRVIVNVVDENYDCYIFQSELSDHTDNVLTNAESKLEFDEFTFNSVFAAASAARETVELSLSSLTFSSELSIVE